MGHGHDGDHGIDSRGAGKGAAVGDEKALDRVRLMVGTDHRRRRISAHPAGAHLVKADVSHLPGSIAVPVDLVHEAVDATALPRAVSDVGSLAGEDLPGAGRLQDANAGLDPSQGRSGSSKMPDTAVDGCSRSHFPTAGARTPDRNSSAGVPMAPAAATTARLRTIKVKAGIPGWRTVARTPAARPSSISTRSTAQLTMILARRR